MFYRIYYILGVLIIFYGCSSPDPPKIFLTSDLKITTIENGLEKIELLRMKPIDLYNVFDINVTKKWKKLRNDSWKLIIKGTNPVTKKKTTYVFILSPNYELQNEVLITKVLVNNQNFNTGEIENMMLKLDEALFGEKPKDTEKTSQ